MALTSEQKSSRLFKKGFGLAETITARDFFEEAYVGPSLVMPSQIWTEADKIPTTAPSLSDGEISGVIQYYDKLELTHIAGSTDRAYYDERLKDALDFTVDATYNYKLYENDGTTPIADGQGDWLVDRESGVLSFYGTLPSISASSPPMISFYKYVGTKGLEISGATSGINVKDPVVAATIEELSGTTYSNTISGFTTLPTDIDGITTFNESDRFLIKNQTDEKQNGIYQVSGTTLVRATDHDGNPFGEVGVNDYTFVTSGDTLIATAWVLGSTDGEDENNILPGIDTQNWKFFSQSKAYDASGTGIKLQDGSTFYLDLDEGGTHGSGLEQSVDGVRVKSSILTDINENTSGVTSLSTEISTETSARISGDTSLSTDISTETSIRISADNSLSTEILANAFSLADGNGTTASGNTVNLGGTLTLPVTLEGSQYVTIGSSASSLSGFEINFGASGYLVNDTAGGGMYFQDKSSGGIFFNLGRNNGDTAGSFGVQSGRNIYNQAGSSISFQSDVGDGTNYANLYMDSNDINLFVSNQFGLDLHRTNGAKFTDNRATKFGIEYAGDYSNDFQLYSLVDKNYVDTNISTEESARISGDTSLSTELSTELSNRISGDTSLSTLISTEESNRISADNSLSTAIDGFQVTDGDGLSYSGDTLNVNVDDFTVKIVNDEIRGQQTWIQNSNTVTISGGTSGLTGIQLDYDPVTPVYAYINGLEYLISPSTTGQANFPFYYSAYPPISGTEIGFDASIAGFDLESGIDLVTIKFNYIDETP